MFFAFIFSSSASLIHPSNFSSTMSFPFDNNERWRQARAGQSGVPPRQDRNAATSGMPAAPRQHVSWAAGASAGPGYATPSPPTTDNRAAGTGRFNPSSGDKTSGLDMSGASFGSPGDASDITVPGPFHNPYLGENKIDKTLHYETTRDGYRIPPGFTDHLPVPNDLSGYDEPSNQHLIKQLVYIGWDDSANRPLYVYDCISGDGYDCSTMKPVTQGDSIWNFYIESHLPRMPNDPVLQFDFAWNFVPSSMTFDHGWNFSNANPIFQAAMQWSPGSNAAVQVDLFRNLPNFKAASDNIQQALFAGVPLGIKADVGGVFTKGDAIAALETYLHEHMRVSPDQTQVHFDLGGLFRLVTANPNLPHLVPYEFVSLINYIQTHTFPPDWNNGLQPRSEVSLLHAIGASPLLDKIGSSDVKFVLSAPSVTQAALETEFKTFDRDSFGGEIKTQHVLKRIGTKSGNKQTYTTKPQVLKEHCEMSSELLLFIRQNLAPSPMRDMFVGLVELNCGLAGIIKSQCAQEVSKMHKRDADRKEVAERTLSSFRPPHFSYQYFAPTITPDFSDPKTNGKTVMSRGRSKPVSPFCSSHSAAQSLGFPYVGARVEVPNGTVLEVASATPGYQQGQAKRSRSCDSFRTRYHF